VTSRTTSLRAARAIHRAIVWFAPAEVRRAYRAEMIATFEAASDAAASHGRLALTRLLWHELIDVLAAHRARRSNMRWPQTAAHATQPTESGRQIEWVRVSAWRQTWRSLTRRPAYLAAIVLTLGCGTGIMTAVFSLVDTVLLKPLPYPDADQLVTVYESSPVARDRTSLIAPGRLEDWQRLNRSFVALSGIYNESVTDTSGDEPQRLEGRRVTPRFFAVYATPPIAGRIFSDTEEAPTGPGAAVISERFWMRRFNRSAAAVGHALSIGGRPYSIVGVMPSTFAGGTVDVWLPAQVTPWLLGQRNARFVNGIGRMRPGVTLAAAAADLAAIQQGLAKQFPKTDEGWSAELRPLKQARIGDARNGLVVVFAAVASLWLMALANIAGLMLAQIHRRQRELVLRAALGASRTRVMGTVIREGVLLGGGGALVGAGIAFWLTSVMTSTLTRTPRINELTMDWRALGFALAASLIAAAAFSLAPAIAATRRGVTDTLAGQSRAVTGRHRAQRLLVISQVALSVLLVGSATLLLRSYYNLTRVETGFDASNVITFHLGARWDEDRTRIEELQTQLLARLEHLPHVSAAGTTNFLPASGATLRYQVHVDGIAGPNPDGSITVGTRMISAGYLRAIRAPLLSGEWCPTPSSDPNAPLTAMLNRQFVERHADGQNVVGRTLRMSAFSATFTITGVVGDLAEDSHATAPVPYVYTCNRLGAWPDPNYVARTTDARAFVADLRRIVREIDPSRAIFDVRPLQDVMDSALDQPRLDAAVLGLFAGAALTLAAIGLYSLFMLVVSEGVREIAVRLAIGAAPGQVMRLVMSGAGRLLASGLVIGIVLTAAADRLLRGVLFGVSPLDFSALAAAVLTIALVSGLAVFGPALRAARIAPIEALRGD
jgi:putative ABC transport system permease protein